MWIRQYAWLSSKAPKDNLTRFKRFENSEIGKLPNISDYARLLIDTLLNIGVCESHGYGPVALTWVNLSAWCHMTGESLLGWESEVLVNWSRDFVSEFESSDDKDRPAPWVPEVVDRVKIANNVGSLLRNLSRRRRKKHGQNEQ